uniref:Uncharacterized protein n=1 Tax=Candidatus Kentrum sp. LFY TaxID=2126342 RepID=A0A450WZ03_9GAMM|nr:MAG: hypothetical protein BECKLFY1418C_GA0070996_11143 [Candidatus Kentron sp. LFY]
MIKQTTGKLLEEKVVLDIEGIDWYLNLYQPMLRTGGGVATFFREEQEHRGAKVASTALMNPMTKSFVQEIHDFAKGQRKDEVTQERLAKFSGQERILYTGKAQEKFNTFRVNLLLEGQDLSLRSR